MFARQTDVNISPMADGVLLAIYFVVAVLVFGVAVPAGNFIPGMTIGAALGRTFGEVPAPPLPHEEDSAAPTSISVHLYRSMDMLPHE